MVVMLNVLRLGKLTEDDMLSRLQLGLVPGLRQGCTVIIFDGYVMKRVTEFSVQPNTCHKFEDLAAVRAAFAALLFSTWLCPACILHLNPWSP